VNLILFERHEMEQPLPVTDPRARHITDVLRLRPGDEFDVGLIDGPRGKATLISFAEDSLLLSFVWAEEPPAQEPITLVLGRPRPQTARKMLEEATALGVRAMHFVLTERGEPSYGASRLWVSGEWRRHLIAGAEQAFSTRLPLTTWSETLVSTLDTLPEGGSRLALDNYESSFRLNEAEIMPPVVLALGPERGWSPRERERLRDAGFIFANLGERVLRVETACVAAISLVRAALGSM
jgi:16S rRNA (uracil1498-N3)-methyltransferase